MRWAIDVAAIIQSSVIVNQTITTPIAKTQIRLTSNFVQMLLKKLFDLFDR